MSENRKSVTSLIYLILIFTSAIIICGEYVFPQTLRTSQLSVSCGLCRLCSFYTQIRTSVIVLNL